MKQSIAADKLQMDQGSCYKNRPGGTEISLVGLYGLLCNLIGFQANPKLPRAKVDPLSAMKYLSSLSL